MRQPTRVLASLVAALLALACEHERTPPPVDTAATPIAPRATPPRDSPPPAPAVASWDADAGPVLVVHDSAPASALVVFPRYADSLLSDTVHFDASAVEGRALDLFGRAGRVGAARLGTAAVKDWSGSGCIEWPTAPLRNVTPDSGTLPLAWSVAFAAGRVRPVALDSLAALPRADSAHLAAEITRLAAALPGDTALAFRGVPFAVNDAYRFSPAPGVGAVVAEVERRLNQEANPLEQQILLVAEHDSAAADGRLRMVYFERRSGGEDALETFDVLAAVMLPDPPRLALVLVRAGARTNAYALLERNATGRWRLRWTSARTGC